MKELEPRFPGITIECVRFEVASEVSTGSRPACVGEVDEDAWRERGRGGPARGAGGAPARGGHAGRADARARRDRRREETEDELLATVEGEDLGLLIGKHGATIDALQHLAMRIALRGGESASR